MSLEELTALAVTQESGPVLGIQTLPVPPILPNQPDNDIFIRGEVR